MTERKEVQTLKHDADALNLLPAAEGQGQGSFAIALSPALQWMLPTMTKCPIVAEEAEINCAGDGEKTPGQELQPAAEIGELVKAVEAVAAA